MGNIFISETKKQQIIDEILNNIPSYKYTEWKSSRYVVNMTLRLMWNNSSYLQEPECKIVPGMLYQYIPKKYKSNFHC